MFLKKKATALFILCSFSLGYTGQDREKRISELERQMLEVGAYHKNNTFGAVFAPSKQFETRGEFFLDLLFYKANLGESDFSFSYPTTQGGNPSLPYYAKIGNLSFDWNIGVRVGVSKDHAYEDCSLSIIYTYFSTLAKEGHRKNLPTSFLSFISSLEPDISLKSSYEVEYQNLDLLISKSYFISEKILYSSSLGLKASLIKQDQKSYQVLSVSKPSTILFSSKLEDLCNFYGIGPKVGLFSRWYIFKEISLINSLSGSLLYGYYKVNDDFFSSEKKKNEDETLSKIKIKDSFHSFSPYIEGSIGISWNRAFFREKIVATLSCFYEILFFWRQNKTISGAAEFYQKTDSEKKEHLLFSRKADDVAFKGVVVKASIDF
jgi:hypothetical protein